MKEKTIRLFNLLKLIMAIPILLADIAVVLVCLIDGSFALVFMFLVLGGITFDYITIARAEIKTGSWYELKNVA